MNRRFTVKHQWGMVSEALSAKDVVASGRRFANLAVKGGNEAAEAFTLNGGLVVVKTVDILRESALASFETDSQ
ncbi:hypothetical protein Pan258_13810 [Symmachiella dynata]|nr:hypothetical protein Pan258_13810 [Symmachiella dynata]